MFACHIFSFSLLSISWVSTASAVLVIPQFAGIESFLQNPEVNLDVACGAFPQPILDAYFKGYIDQFELTLKPYLKDLNDALRNGEINPPEPDQDLKEALHGFTRFVDLIGYSNVTILNQLRKIIQVWEPTVAIINDEYVNQLSNQYRINRSQNGGLFFQPYMLHVARLYSMNKTMFDRTGRIHPMSIPEIYRDTINRFHNYRDLIIKVHHEMAQYLKIQTLGQYDRTFETLNNQFDQLTNTQNIPGIRTAVTHLGNSILSIIVIYGIPGGTPGTQIVSLLLDNRWIFRRIMGMELDESVSERLVYLTLLERLKAALEAMERHFETNHPWIFKIPQILEKAITLLRKTNFQVQQ
jgi:hypothetical protein